MSVGPLGMTASIAGTTQSKGGDANRVQQEDTAQQRSTQSTEKAEAAGGVGETEEDQESQERDADGRRLWETNGEAADKDTATDSSEEVRSKDATGQRGINLDLSG